MTLIAAVAVALLAGCSGASDAVPGAGSTMADRLYNAAKPVERELFTAPEGYSGDSNAQLDKRITKLNESDHDWEVTTEGFYVPDPSDPMKQAAPSGDYAHRMVYEYEFSDGSALLLLASRGGSADAVEDWILDSAEVHRP